MTVPELVTHLFTASRQIMSSVGTGDLHVPLGFIDQLQATQRRQDVIDCFGKWSAELMRADHHSIIVPDSLETCKLREIFGPDATEMQSVLPLNATVGGQVIRQEACLYVDDVASLNMQDTLTLQRRGIGSSLLAPLLRGGRCFGAIGAGFTEPPRDPGHLLAGLSVIGRCLATQLLLIEQIDDLVRAATTDPLTSVGNRRRFNEQATLLWEDWQENNVPFSLISVDIDHFKSVNDQFGHDVGDDVIRITADRLVGKVRGSDEVVRMGGEEFCVLLKGSTLHEAGTLAERCRLALCEQPFSAGDQALDVTASFGVAEVTSTDYSFSTLVRRLDQALYTAKAKGRNQVEVSRPEPEDSIFFMTG